MPEVLIQLQTQPTFLHTHFPQVRSRLGSGASQHFTLEESLIVQPVLERKHVAFSKKVGSFILSGIVGLTCLIACVLLIPSLYYQIFPAQVVEVATPENTILTGTTISEANKPIVAEYQPPVDPTLPVGEWLIIPRIGVRTQPQATLEPEEALQTGVWRVPDFGKPGEKNYIEGTDTRLPIILAAHRYGWQWWWQTDYWQYHSFYNLPETQPGDRIEIITNQRKWVYEIYAGEEGEQISDYGADLILYTCKFLNSPIRHFRYARLVNPNADTQALQVL